MADWNLWHGCHKISQGCKNCYVYRADKRYDRDSSVVQKTGNFNLPIRRTRDGGYKIPSGEMVYTCFTSDFFLEDADAWRPDAWRMMKQRADLEFLFITKRIHRFYDCIPKDWGNGYPNVHICCTVETQERADFRLPIFREAPIQKKSIVCEPLLEKMDVSAYLGDWVLELLCGGESGEEARPVYYDWILDLRRQCIEHDVSFYFHQTGLWFFKDGRMYRVNRKFQHKQARKAGINFTSSRGNKEREDLC